jgi:hypothetical protein
MKKTKFGLAAGALALSSTLAWAAGLFPGFPIVGNSGYCASFVNGVCTQTIPAGPSGLTGSELIPADTGLPNGQSPQTVSIPTSLLSGGTNLLYGGDMDTNLGQRLSTVKGLASLAGITPTAAVMSADGWWVYSSGSTVTVTFASGAPQANPVLNTSKTLDIARTASSTPNGQICVGQTLDAVTAEPLIGNNAVFSFWEQNGTANSALNGAFTAQIAYSSGTSAATQATLGFAGQQGSKYALAGSGQAGGPTNYTVATPVISLGTGTVGASGVVTFTGATSGSQSRFAIAAPIPVDIPGTSTAVTDVSVQLCFLPTASAAGTTDNFQVQGLQLEAKPGTVTVLNPNGVILPSSFQRRTLSTEAAIEYSYWYFNYEAQVAGGKTTIASCTDVSVTVSNCLIKFPVPMRIVPALSFTDGFQIFTTTGYSAVNACSGLALSTSYATVSDNKGFLMNCTATTVPAAGTANNLTSLGSTGATGIISASALP